MPGKWLDCGASGGIYRLRKPTAHDCLGDLLLAVSENEELESKIGPG